MLSLPIFLSMPVLHYGALGEASLSDRWCHDCPSTPLPLVLVCLPPHTPMCRVSVSAPCVVSVFPPRVSSCQCFRPVCRVSVPAQCVIVSVFPPSVSSCQCFRRVCHRVVSVFPPRVSSCQCFRPVCHRVVSLFPPRVSSCQCFRLVCHRVIVSGPCVMSVFSLRLTRYLPAVCRQVT